jgi:hypothetical protein
LKNTANSPAIKPYKHVIYEKGRKRETKKEEKNTQNIKLAPAKDDYHHPKNVTYKGIRQRSKFKYHLTVREPKGQGIRQQQQDKNHKKSCR